MTNAVAEKHEAIIIGGGQSGLATAFYLMRAGVDVLVLDDQDRPGGAWLHTWPSLTLFSTAAASNLPGMMMPSFPGFPPAEHVVEYLEKYEDRYDVPVERPVHIVTVTKDGTGYDLEDREGRKWRATSVIAATGTWSSPFIPHYPGNYEGKQWHSAIYPGPSEFEGQSVAVVGAANSAAQIAADLIPYAEVTWYTSHEPRWMPDDVDGRVLFARNRERLLAMNNGVPDPGPSNELGDIVMVDPVLRARNEGSLVSTPMFTSLDEVHTDHLIWCTGFRPALGPVRSLLRETEEVDGKDENGGDGQRAGREGQEKDAMNPLPGLYLVGYGDWVGPGSATITGVAPFAKAAARGAAERVGKKVR